MTTLHKTNDEWKQLNHPTYTILDKVGEKTKGKHYKYPLDIILVKCKKCNTEQIIVANTLNNKRNCKYCVTIPIGEKRGTLTVIGYKREYIKNRPVIYYQTKCDCGNISYKKADIFNYNESGCILCHKSSKFIPSNKVKNIKRYFSKLKGESKRKNRIFEITLQDIENLLVQQKYKCILSNISISFTDGTASVDRINNNLGYTKDNIQIVHRTVNYMKNELSQDEFIRYCKLIASTS
jgi:hypothetical protein